MTQKGNCERETDASWKDYVKWHTDLTNLARAIKAKDLLLGKILKRHASRFDSLEHRVILLEDRVYGRTGGSSGKSPCK